MVLYKSVVGKLWMTIIGLVAVVLLFLSLFMNQFLDTYFSKPSEQLELINQLAQKVAGKLSQHPRDDHYFEITGDLLSVQDARLIRIRHADLSEETVPKGKDNILASDIFTAGELSTILSGNEISKTFVWNGGETGLNEFLASAVPIRLGEKPPYDALVVIQPLQSPEQTKSHIKKLLVFAAVIGFLLTTFFAFFLTSRITRPLIQMKKAADLMSRGKYTVRVSYPSSDEIGELARTFNHMAEKLQTTIRDLNHEKEQLSGILRSMADGVISFDAEGNVIMANPLGERVIREWNQIRWNDNDPMDQEKGRKVPKPLLELFSSISQGSREVTSTIHVKNRVWSVVMAPLYATSDHIRGAVAVLRDTTEEYRLDKLRKDFVANVSHELRTPISMLQGYSEALLDDIAASPEERNELIRVIHDESVRMGRLVKDLLDLSRMETGHLEMNEGRVHIPLLLDRVYRKFNVLCKEQGIILKSFVTEDDLILEKADEDRLEQVLTNLLDNAIRHSPKGSEIVMSARSAKEHGQPGVILEIADQGEGIPEEDLPYIFERFYKADKARKRASAGGTGLGLAIVKNIIQSHGGHVYVSSKPGQGTTFSIFLPKNRNSK